jgi:tRNA A37 methylthiotransferase MiaB
MGEAVRTFAITTLGCKVNQYEGQAMRERLLGLGLEEVPFGDRAGPI